MSLYDRAGFEAFVNGLTGTRLVEQWGSIVGKVGEKVFCLLGLDRHDVCFKVSETAFAGLTSLPGIGQAPYFAKRQWVSVAPDALDEETLRQYLMESHRTIAAKLTRKERLALGLEAQGSTTS